MIKMLEKDARLIVIIMSLNSYFYLLRVDSNTKI